MIRMIFTWWGRQLWEVLPARWRQPGGAGGGEAVLLTLGTGRAGERASVQAVRRRGRREVALGRFALDAAGLERLRAALGGAGRRGISLLLPPNLLLEQRVTLPLAAESGLETALRWEMDRLTPFNADAVHWTWQVEQRDRERARLLLCLRLAPKAAIAPVLDALSAAGLAPSQLAAAAAPARAVPLTRERRGRWGAAALTGAAVLFAVAGLAAVAAPFVRQEQALRSLAARIEAARPRAEAADALRRRLIERAASVDVMAAEAARVGDPLRVLAAVTNVLPDGTFLQELSMRDRSLTIAGQSRAAATLIPALAGDAAFRNPVFAAPVTRNEFTGAEAFTIKADAQP